MYKNLADWTHREVFSASFNPCFNGSMYKNQFFHLTIIALFGVSILVLMDLCIKTQNQIASHLNRFCFNPCFNGSMYKNSVSYLLGLQVFGVSILVLMDLCIKTEE